jgi:hypothetical protein
MELKQRIGPTQVSDAPLSFLRGENSKTVRGLRCC